ncbi:craniofacial development protein 2-like [Erpetoichthys calabaricus]|uniref:craniofacial development protein 2-like n=1 Tax=Erpetoichthys calabaricus TaxID=27687 RepID=UPI0010A08E7B|nr:craniofacial development protein 2-like [Erpetoichthys calabaricus]
MAHFLEKSSIPQATATLTEWNMVSDRIITARLRSQQVKVTVIQIYAPTKESDEAAKAAFYDQLQDELTTVPRHDLLLVIGDFNAQLNGDCSGFEVTMGPHGSGTRTNDNSERLRSFYASNNLCIGNTFFQHKRIHKMTWRSPGGLYKNKIDYICISKRWCLSLLDVKSRRGADVGSDHNLLVAKSRLKLMRSTPKPQRPRPFNVTKLKETPIAQQFQLELRNCFKILAETGGEESVENDWTRLHLIVIESATTTIGRRRGTYRNIKDNERCTNQSKGRSPVANHRSTRKTMSRALR